MRLFNPFAVWNAVPLASRTASVIKSIQTGTIAITGTNYTATATVTAVTVDKSVLIMAGSTIDTVNSAYPYLTLTNSTTITATRGFRTNETATASYVLVEFY